MARARTVGKVEEAWVVPDTPDVDVLDEIAQAVACKLPVVIYPAQAAKLHAMYSDLIGRLYAFTREPDEG